MHIAIQFGLISAAWRWGDWKHWKNYYPSVLFLIIGDLVYNFVTYNYPLWVFHPSTFDKWIYPNHTIITLGIDFLGFPALAFLFLSHYPSGKWKQVFYVLAWVLLNTLFETISSFFTKGISYQHGWNLGWSIVVNILLFILIRIHFMRPFIAWMIFVFVAVFFMVYFHVPISKMK